MPAITNLYKSIKTNKALECLQDMVISGNQIKILGFSVSSKNGELDPTRTIDDLLPTWYPVEGRYTDFAVAPSNIGTRLSLVMHIPAAVTNTEEYITEVYIFAEYKEEVFLFGICQTQINPPSYRYIPNTSYTQTCSFDLTQYEGNINIIINQVQGISLNPPLYVDDEGNISLQYDETLHYTSKGLGVDIPELISDEIGNKLEIGEDGKLYTVGGGASGDLGGRVSNAIDVYDTNIINFENVSRGYSATPVSTPILSATPTQNFGTLGVFTLTSNASDNSKLWSYTANSNLTLSTPTTGLHIDYCFAQPYHMSRLYWRHGDTGEISALMKTAELAYSDDGTNWTTFQNVATSTNTLGTYFTFDIDPTVVKSNGAHRFWSVRNIKRYDLNSTTFNCNLIQWSGYNYTILDSTSLGYIAVGSLQIIDNRYISGFGKDSYLLNKNLVEDWSSYDFRITGSFPQVEEQEPILSFPNHTQMLYIQEGKLHLLRSGVVYTGDIIYQPNTYYYFKILYNDNTGYYIQSSTDNLNFTTEIYLNDSVNFIRNKTMYLGIIASDSEPKTTTGTFDLQNTGFKYINGNINAWDFPINSPTSKDCSIIQVTFNGRGLMANGRNADNTLKNKLKNINTVGNTIMYPEGTSVVALDDNEGLTCLNYEEVEKSEDNENPENTSVFEKDINKVFKYSIIYPNFLQRGLKYEVTKTTYQASNVSPIFTSNSQNGFNVIDSNNDSNAYVLFNGTTSKSVGSWNTYEIQQEFPKKFLSRDYKIKISNLLVYPTSWRYEGSNDGSTWITLDTRYNQLFSINQEKHFTFESIVAYRYYRLKFLSGLENEKGGNLSRIQFLGTLIDTVTPTEEIVIDLSDPTASFAPNKYLEENGFDFNLVMNYSGNLSVVRKFNYKNYRSDSPYTQYTEQLGISWSDFMQYVNNPNLSVPNGVQFSSYYGSAFNTGVIGTEGSLGNISTITTTGTPSTAPYKISTLSAISLAPGFIYFVFNNPVHFDNFVTTMWKDTNYIFDRYSLDVSNDFQSWVSIVKRDSVGYESGGSTGLNYYPFPSTTPSNTAINTVINDSVDFPPGQYYKYVRLGIFHTTGYRAATQGFFLGGHNSKVANSETLTEKVLDDILFLNTKDSGISIKFTKKPKSTVYQVKFEDTLGYVKSEGIKDDIVKNNTTVYSDIYCTNILEVSRTAYEVQCKQWLRNYIDQGIGTVYPGVPGGNETYPSIVSIACSSSTGVTANSWNLLWDTTTGYDFASGTNDTVFTIRFHERCIIDNMHFRTWGDGNSYNPQNIWIEGSNDVETSENPTWENVLGYNAYAISHVAGATAVTQVDSNGIVTNFDDRGALTPIYQTNKNLVPYSAFNSWEWQIKIKTPTTFNGDSSRIIAHVQDAKGLLVGVTSTGIFRIYAGNSGWNIISDGRSTKALNTDTWYHLKVQFTGTQYKILVSTDNIEFEEYYSINSGVKIQDVSTMLCGGYPDRAHSFYGGSLDLNDTKLIADGKVFWKPYLDEPVTQAGTDTIYAVTNYDIPLNTEKSYLYYRIRMNTDVARGILLQVLKPHTVHIDPINKNTHNVLIYGDDFSELGNDRPLRYMVPPVTASPSTVPVDNSPVSVASTRGDAWNITQYGTGLWNIYNTPGNRWWCDIWQFAPYPFRMSTWTQYTHSVANYLAEDLLIYGVNAKDFDNGITSNYHRLANLKSTSDIFTSLTNNNAINSYYETTLSDNSSHIGYRYNRMFVCRDTNNYPVLREVNLHKIAGSSTPTIIPMYYTQEWKWTNIKGNKNDVFTSEVYDDPFLTPNTTSTLQPAYRVEYNGKTRWVKIKGNKDTYLPNNYKDIFSNWSLVGNLNPKNTWAYELTYTDLSGNTHTAYTFVEGSPQEFTNNGTELYKDIDFKQVINVEYAYQCTYNDQIGYTKVSGEVNEFLPDGTPVYSDLEFTSLIENSTVNTWKFTGVINKKYQYTGSINKKWKYTGDIDNQYVYTGNTAGWRYTGKTEVVYDNLPHLELALNRKNSRRVTKRDVVGVSYPIANSTDPNTIVGYLHDVSGTVGNICPIGLDIYPDAQTNTPTSITDGTQVFQSFLGVDRYSYEFLYMNDTGATDGTFLESGQVMYYDADLTTPTDPAYVDSSLYYWDTPTFNSRIGSVEFQIPDNTSSGITDKNLKVIFDSEKYSITYDGVTKDIISGEYIKDNTFQFNSQNLMKLNLSKSLFSWWEWNGLITSSTQKTQQLMFRIGTLESSGSSVDTIQPFYPWKIGDGSGTGGSNVYHLDEKLVKKKSIIVVDAVNKATNLDNVPEKVKENAEIFYNLPAYPYIPYNLSNNVTGYTFTNGGMLVALTATNITLFATEAAPITFTNFVGMLPISQGTVVKASEAVYMMEF